jgi:hypothetical protein
MFKKLWVMILVLLVITTCGGISYAVISDDLQISDQIKWEDTPWIFIES